MRCDRRLALADYAERIAGTGCWEWTLESDEVLWSDNLFRMFGVEPDSIVPTLDFVVGKVHPDDRGRLEHLLSTLRADGPDAHGAEYRIVHDDGSIRTLRVTVAIAPERAGGSPTRMVGAVQDVTLARRLDRQLAAHVAVTRALDEWTSLETGARGLLSGLAHALELPFATFWVPDGREFCVRGDLASALR